MGDLIGATHFDSPPLGSNTGYRRRAMNPSLQNTASFLVSILLRVGRS
jgi:hypothetical protein